MAFAALAWASGDFATYAAATDRASGLLKVRDSAGAAVASVSLDGVYANTSFCAFDDNRTLAIAERTYRAVADPTGDERTDVLWRNSDGSVGYWDGGAANAYTALGRADPNWRIQGGDDFNGDGKAEVLWRNEDGTVGVWNAGSAGDCAALGGADASWGIAGTGDFDGDGKADILWRNDSGAVGYWSAGSSAAFTSCGGADASWQIAGVGDFNGDGR